MASSGTRNSHDLKEIVADCLLRHCESGARIGIGLSGGIDSVVLLNALLESGYAKPEELLAIHVNHALSPEAGNWENFCRQLCAANGVQFVARRVQVPVDEGLGLEGAARKVRYEILCNQPIDALLLAHQLEDQAETVLLQLLRGGGVRGLAAMPQARAHPAGPLILRPFLTLSRNVIETYAERRGLVWVDDASNRDDIIRRNFLRSKVFPVLSERFPGAISAFASAAARFGDAQALLDEIAQADLEQLNQSGSLDVCGLLLLGRRRARNALVYWLKASGTTVPSGRAVEEAIHQLEVSGASSDFRLQCGSDAVLLYRHRLHLCRNNPGRNHTVKQWDVAWSGQKYLQLPNGVLHFEAGTGPGISTRKLEGKELSVMRRRGGERLRVRNSGPRRMVKTLFQERGIPRWQRLSYPFLWHGEQLVAVPGLGVAADWQAEPDEPCVKVSWEPYQSTAES